MAIAYVAYFKQYLKSILVDKDPLNLELMFDLKEKRDKFFAFALYSEQS